MEQQHPELVTADSPSQRVDGAPLSLVCHGGVLRAHAEPGEHLTMQYFGTLRYQKRMLSA